jgi:hypothetical protein
MLHRMRNCYLLFAVLTGSQLALAEPALDIEMIAKVQSTLDFCVQINPGIAAKMRDQPGIMMQGIPAEELAKLRESDKYRAVYASTSEVLNQADKMAAVKACNDFVGSGK